MRRTPTSASRITVYSMHQPNPLGGAQRLHRTRLDISTGTPSIVSELDAAVDARAASLGAFAAISTHDADFVVYVNSSGTQLLAGPSGDAVGMFHVVGSFSSSTLAALDLAIRDASQPVSPSNPIGVLFAVSSGGGPALAVIEVTNTTALATGPMIGLPGVTQPQRSLATPHWATVRSLGDHGSSGHWIVANVNHDPSAPTGSASSVVLVHEVLGDGSSVRTVSVPGESYADRTTIEIAQSGASIRLVERANGTGLVTRSIACE